MHALVLDLGAQHRPATLLVTHNVDEAAALADCVLVLDRGRIVLDLLDDALQPHRRTTSAFAGLRTRLLDQLGLQKQAA